LRKIVQYYCKIKPNLDPNPSPRHDSRLRGIPPSVALNARHSLELGAQQVTLVEIVGLRALFLLSIDIHYKTNVSAFYAVIK